LYYIVDEIPEVSMGRRRKDRALPKDVPALVRRIDWLLHQAFGNNITWMAEVLGVSHAALSRVLAGQWPSAKMLEALVQRANVNAGWLLVGDTQTGQSQGVGAALCPVADALLPAEPQHYPERLSAFCLPVASPFILGQPYWYRVRPDDPVVADKANAVLEGDYLLVETGEKWTRRPEALAGRMVVLRRSEGDTVVLGKVAAREDPFEKDEPQHEVRMFGPPEEAVLILRTRADARAKPVRRLIERPCQVLFYLDDVVGVALQVTRILQPGH
jgi:hypothetical protein